MSDQRNRRTYHTFWRKQHPDRVRELAKKKDATYRKKHPMRIYARNHLNLAIRLGHIERGSCEVCGKPNAEAHHDDYSKPFIVQWFCKQHHHELKHNQ